MSEGVPVGEYELSSIVKKMDHGWLFLNRVKRWLFVPVHSWGIFVTGRRKQHPLIAEATQLFNPQAEVNAITLVLGQWLTILPIPAGNLCVACTINWLFTAGNL